MNKEDNFPVKIKQIIEEIRVGREQTNILQTKLANIDREAQKIQQVYNKEPELAQLADEVIKLEQLYAESMQENRLLKMKASGGVAL